jgi:hypothetical protein
MMKNKDEIKLNDYTLEQVMASDSPQIYIVEMKDQPDGDCLMTFDSNKAFDDLYKKRKGRKRVTKKGLGNFVLELITKGLNKEDGYDIKTLKKNG